MSKIEKKGDTMVVPDKLTIPYIEGDGVGIEITSSVQKIVNSAIQKTYKGKREIDWEEVLCGEKAFKKKNTWLPKETIDAFKEYHIGIKGPLTTPIGGGIRSLNVALRQNLDLYVCMRPVKWYKGVLSPIKHPERVNMTIFRENTEDIYAGIEWKTGTPEANKFLNFLTKEMGVTKIRFPQSSSFGVKPISREGTERLVKAAVHYAIKHGLPSVTLVHKGNIMKFTEGAFKQWGYEIARKEFGNKIFTFSQYDQIKREKGELKAKEAYSKALNEKKIIIKDVITDAFLQNTLISPEKYSVIATMNLNGDYISDQLAAMVGGIGIAPGANINYDTGNAIFEATHGTAPDIAGKNIVNPCSLLLSSVLMLQYIGWNEPAELIEKSLEKSFGRGEATQDLSKFMENGKTLSTSQFTENIISLF